MTVTRGNDYDRRRELNRFLENGESGRGSATGESSRAGRGWAPAVDVHENEQAITINAELPGMKKDEIDIQLTGDTLTLSGERRQPEPSRGESFHRVERVYGRFSRTFQIETPIEAGNVSASYEQGVLTVRLPKQEAVKPRQIAINTK